MIGMAFSMSTVRNPGAHSGVKVQTVRVYGYNEHAASDGKPTVVATGFVDVGPFGPMDCRITRNGTAYQATKWEPVANEWVCEARVTQDAEG